MSSKRLTYETSIDMPCDLSLFIGTLHYEPATSRLSLNRQRAKVRVRKQLMLLGSTGVLGCVVPNVNTTHGVHGRPTEVVELVKGDSVRNSPEERVSGTSEFGLQVLTHRSA